jgi:hypothetical protein
MWGAQGELANARKSGEHKKKNEEHVAAGARSRAYVPLSVVVRKFGFSRDSPLPQSSCGTQNLSLEGASLASTQIGLLLNVAVLDCSSLPIISIRIPYISLPTVLDCSRGHKCLDDVNVSHGLFNQQY